MKRIIISILSTMALVMMLLPDVALAIHDSGEGFCTTTGNYTVCTDKEDYAPEETVQISGSGFAANAELTVKVTRPDGSVVAGDGSFADWPTPYDSLTTTPKGNFDFEYVLDGIEGEYLIEIMEGNWYGALDTVLARHTFTDNRSITAATVNGGSTTTVGPGENIEVSITVQVSNPDTWGATRWQIGSGWSAPSGCDDHDNHQNGTFTETFDITAPSNTGTYDLTLTARQSCQQSGGGTSFTLTGAVIVEEEPPVEPLPNPTLSDTCGLDIVLVMDESSSIDSTEFAQMQDAFVDFVNSLADTPTEFALVDFGTLAYLREDFTDDTDTIIDAINGTKLGGGTQYTNWEQALITAHDLFPNRDNPDLIIFASDGNPTAYGSPATIVYGNTTGEAEALARAITEANDIKGDDIRIITIGIGNDLDSNNMVDISSADAYYSSDFEQLADDLAAIASELCGGTITVHKVIDEDGDLDTTDDQTASGTEVTGWQYVLSVSGGSATPTSDTTDENGTTGAFDISITGDTATVTVTETVQSGYGLLDATCSGATGTFNPASNSIDIVMDSNDIVSVTFYNRPITEICTDGIDNDDDGLIDCLDPDCPCGECEACNTETGACEPITTETECTDGIDNDCDGLIDCADPDCPGCSDCYQCNSETGACEPICAGTDTECGCGECTNCNDQDGWYNSGDSYVVQEGTEYCTYQPQEYRDYYCSNNECLYNITGEQDLPMGCTTCGECTELESITIVSDTTTQIDGGGNAVEAYEKAYPEDWDSRIDYDFPDEAIWIWESYYVDQPINGDVITFLKDFTLPDDVVAGSIEAIMYITADNGYEIWLNDTVVGSAQVDGDWQTYHTEDYVHTSGWKTVESWDISSLLQAGTNSLLIYGANEYMGPIDGQANGTIYNNPGGVIFEISISYCVPVEDGTDCSTDDYYDAWEYYCDGDSVYKHQLFHDFYCDDGVCTDHPYYTDETWVEDCDDGDPCNGVETCADGVCVPGTPVECSSGYEEDGATYIACDGSKVCTYQDWIWVDYACDPATGSCVGTEDESKAYTETIGCTDCDDGDPCTIDSCDAGACVNTPNTPNCALTLDTDSQDGMVCEGTTGHTASVADAGTNATYNWTLTGDYTNLSGQGTSSITFDAGEVTVSGNINIQVDVANEFGCTCSNNGNITVVEQSIGDLVWLDANGDGIKDSGETGLGNITVALLNASDESLIATTETTATGYYLFPNLEPGDYIVDVNENDSDMPAGHFSTTYNDPMNVSLAEYEYFFDADFGYGPEPDGVIGNLVWQDCDQDGVYDEGEVGIANITLILRNAAGDWLAETETDYFGNYYFYNNPKGNYTVELDLTDPDLAGYIPTTSTILTAVIASNDLDADFGLVPTGTITVIKVVEGQAPETVWEFSGGLGSFTLPAEGGQMSFANSPCGTYTINETTQGCYITSASCNTGESGTDSVTFTLEPGEEVICTFTNSAVVTADAGPNQTIARGGSVVIGGSPTGSGNNPPFTYSWTPTTGLSDPTLANPTASPTTTTTYTVTVTDANECTASDSMTVTVTGGGGGGGGGGEDIDKCYLIIDMLGRRTMVEIDCCENTTLEECEAYDEEEVHLLELQEGTLVRCGECDDCECYPQIIVMSLSEESIEAPEGMAIVGPIYDFTGYNDLRTQIECSLATYFNPTASVLLNYDPVLVPEGASNPVIAFYSHTENSWVILPPDTGVVAEVGVATGLANYFASPFAVLVSVEPAEATAEPETPQPAHFSASSLKITPAEVKADEKVAISVNITNDGEQSGSYTVDLKIDGETVDSQEITLDAGQSQTVSFNVSETEAGQYEVAVSDLSGEFTVLKPFNWWIFVIIAAIIALGWLAWHYRKKLGFKRA